ncbi:tripartite motif-containing protein 7-like [Limosa lapponica baueri]|uniref:Tripartite motif-containing protein 7-like n=1 Tax=Limosa lapponica baueri TaxID=1758121 RepID=A0A2I0U006_LIMLA|nr:tripartite motif-containing protein 7-like [Limosa lapponica baueri]
MRSFRKSLNKTLLLDDLKTTFEFAKRQHTLRSMDFATFFIDMRLQAACFQMVKTMDARIALTRASMECLQDEACCSICLEIFQDPVSIHCGHSFCRAYITQNWEGLTTNFSCPQCRKMVAHQSFRPNWELANIIEVAKSLNL